MTIEGNPSGGSLKHMLWVTALVMSLGVFAAGEAAGELQSVQVGGGIRMRGRIFKNNWETTSTPGALRIPDELLLGRPIGPWGARSRFAWDSRVSDYDYVEQSTRVNVRASFSHDIEGYVEFKSYHRWEDGAGGARLGNGAWAEGDPVHPDLWQAYVQADDFGLDGLRLRLGRQELELGKGWLISHRTGISHRSFDGVRLAYEREGWGLDAWAVNSRHAGLANLDGDTELYTVSGRYDAWEPAELEVYWIGARDTDRPDDTGFRPPAAWVEDWWGVNQYDTTFLHTAGARVHGATGPWDYDLELATQWGDAGGLGQHFRIRRYGDNSARFDGNWATDGELGYTAEELAWEPRVGVGGAYYSGEDNRDITFREWLNPFHRPEASISFHRLFPAYSYGFLTDLVKGMTNFHQIRATATAHPHDQVTLDWSLAYYGVNETFDRPLSARVGRYQIPLAPGAPFVTESSASDIGVVSHFILRYQHSPDWNVNLGWERLFTGEGLRDGNFTHRNGLEFSGGTARDNADLFYFDTSVRF
ncbi:MAG: alginate export family protein [Candidatus Hydrogenedentota bacterium]